MTWLPIPQAAELLGISAGQLRRIAPTLAQANLARRSSSPRRPWEISSTYLLTQATALEARAARIRQALIAP